MEKTEPSKSILQQFLTDKNMIKYSLDTCTHKAMRNSKIWHKHKIINQIIKEIRETKDLS